MCLFFLLRMVYLVCMYRVLVFRYDISLVRFSLSRFMFFAFSRSFTWFLFSLSLCGYFSLSLRAVIIEVFCFLILLYFLTKKSGKREKRENIS